jgi:hypothetical protein
MSANIHILASAKQILIEFLTVLFNKRHQHHIFWKMKVYVKLYTHVLFN